MLYRIDYQNFLLHAIDYLTLSDIISIQYAVISAKMKNTGSLPNVVSLMDLYPTAEMISTYVQTEDPEILYKMYKKFMDQNDVGSKNASLFRQNVYQCLVKPVLDHNDIFIVCDRSENDYVTALARYIKEIFKLECIDLNELFQKGKVGPIYIDRTEIHDRSVKVAKESVKANYQYMETSSEGRARLLTMMSDKEKRKKLNELGITPFPGDDLDELLTDAWVDDD